MEMRKWSTVIGLLVQGTVVVAKKPGSSRRMTFQRPDRHTCATSRRD
jgi:hypothetical protein